MKKIIVLLLVAASDANEKVVFFPGPKSLGNKVYNITANAVDR